MARRKGAMQGGLHTPDSTEILYARRRAAQWMKAVLNRSKETDITFFECLSWSCGDLGPLLEGVCRESASLRSKEGRRAHAAVKESLGTPRRRFARVCDDLIDDHPCLQDIFAEQITALLEAAIPALDRRSALFEKARQRLESVFGLDREAVELCEFAFLLQTFPRIEEYFENQLEVQRFGNQYLLADMLDISAANLRLVIEELNRFGILKYAYGFSFRLTDALLAFWSPEEMDSSQLFSRPLEGECLPLDSFRIASEEVYHLRRLIEKQGNASSISCCTGRPARERAPLCALWPRPAG